MGKKMVILVTIILAAVAAFILYRRQQVHYHAGFIVFVDGKKQDYSGPRYMDIENCNLHGATGGAKNRQAEKAHLHDGIGDVVHVEAAGATWQDLFRNLGVKFPQGMPVSGFIGGHRVDNILRQPITSGESVVIEAGNQFTPRPSDYVTQARIRSAASQSESCGP